MQELGTLDWGDGCVPSKKLNCHARYAMQAMAATHLDKVIRAAGGVVGAGTVGVQRIVGACREVRLAGGVADLVEVHRQRVAVVVPGWPGFEAQAGRG